MLSARDVHSPGSREALESLCRTYWFPIYAFLRRQGHSPADAEDHTQGFFWSLLRHCSLAPVDPARGKFRSFLLASLRHYLSDQRDRDHAMKRGGGRAIVSLDADSAEANYARQVSDHESPDLLFDRQWALAVLAKAQARLREECARAGKAALFDEIGPNPALERNEPYSQIAQRHGLTENALRVAAHRLRQRYQEIVRDEVRQTVSRPEDVDDEIRHLIAVLAETGARP